MRTLVIEDLRLFRDFLVHSLESQPQLSCILSAKDGREALDIAANFQPQLVFLDILIPKLSGILFAKQLRQIQLSPQFIVVSAEIDPKTLLQIQQINPIGWIDKATTGGDELRAIIQQVLAGKRYISPSIQAELQRIRTDQASFDKLLTRREQEILTLIGAGMSDEEIADNLGMKVSTAQTHRNSIRFKLGCHKSTQLMTKALSLGFWKPCFEAMDLTQSYHDHR